MEHYDLTVEHYDLTMEDYDLTVEHYDLTVEHYDLTVQHYDLTVQLCGTEEYCEETMKYFNRILKHSPISRFLPSKDKNEG